MSQLRTIRFVALTLTLAGCVRAAPEATTETGALVKVTVAPGDPAPVPPVVALAPMPRAVAPRLPVAPMPHEPREMDLTNVDVGLDTGIEAALPELPDPKRIKDVSVPGPNDLTVPAGPFAPPGVDLRPIGIPGAPVGAGLREDPPAKISPAPFGGRSGATRAKLVKHFGGNEESEKAVALGLAWLAKQQKPDGGWEFDKGSFKAERAAATGMALLPFLAAGGTHKDAKGKYQTTVKAGVNWLVKNTATGADAGRISKNMYANAIAALALVEAYGMTRDPALKPTAQAAINFMQKAQGPNGSWGYAPGNSGDTSLSGWQIQALVAAKQAGLAVDDKVLKNAVKFLDFAAGGAKKSAYGYTSNVGASPGTALTAVGLWSRAHIDGWGPEHPGMIDGVAGLVKNGPWNAGPLRNLYYYYYATQVVFRSGGEDWATWNEGRKGTDGSRTGGMRDWLVGAQVRKAGADLGSWDPEDGWFGKECGRLGTTAFCALNLEVYYRSVPAEKKGAKKDADPKP